MDKLVSIVLPVYNGERYLAQSIESVLNQTHKNFELIIVNDGSVDSTEKIVLQYKAQDERIVYIKNEINSKLPKSLNNGFRIAKGEYYTWTSDDNIYHDNAIEEMVNFLEENENIGLVFCGYNVIDENGRDCGFKYTQDGDIKYNNVVGACFLYRSSVAKAVGEYREDMFLVEDYEYWLRIDLKYEIAKIDKYLYDWRRHSKGLTISSRESTGIVLGKLKWLYLKKYEKKRIPEDEIISYFEHIQQFKPQLIERIWQSLIFTLKHKRYFKVLMYKLKRRIIK